MFSDLKKSVFVYATSSHFWAIWFSLLACFITSQRVGASDASYKAELEYRVEDTVKKLIGPLIEPQHVVIIVKVTALPPSQDSGTAPKGGQLPYSTVKVEPGVLERLLSKSSEDDLLQASYEIELAFDESVSEETVTLVTKKIKLKLNIDDKKKILKTTTAKLVKPKVDPIAAMPQPTPGKKSEESSPPDTPLTNQPQTPASPVPQDPSESVRIENERARLELERQKFEASKKEAELNEQFRQERLNLENKLKEQQSLLQRNEKPEEKKDEKANATPEGKPAEAPKTIVDLLKDFQLSILSLMALLGLVLLGILLGGSHKKGLSAISTSMQGLGEALKTSSSGAAVGGADSAGKGAETNGDTSGGTTAGGVGVSGGPQDIIQDERYKQFLTLVEEKIEVLTGENNFGFYRHFLDMVNKQVLFAASILVSVKPETARLLVEAISIEDLGKIRSFLARDGALGEAQASRGKALESFYGKISLDEFTDSPLLTLKGASWITKLTTAQLRGLVLQLSNEDQVTFLALFTPSRIVQIIESTSEEDEKAKIIEILKMVDSAKADDLPETLKRAQEKFSSQQQERLESVKKIIDNPKYFADIVVDLTPDNRERFLKAIAARTELLEVIKDYYIPFDDIEKLNSRIVKDIFGRRPATQTALVLLTAKESLHTMIIEAAPEALRDTVKEELEALKSDDANKRKNTQKSEDIKQEICRYLLQLNREGLLDYRADSESNSSAPKLAAAS